MKRTIIFFLYLIFFVGCKEKKPELYFPSSEILLGDLKFGSDEKITFQVENTGGGLLKIQNVNSSCKCIAINFSKKDIGTNEKATISMVYKADEIGQHAENIVIISNDPKTYKIIEIKANVVK